MKTQPGVVKERNQGKEGEKYKGLLGGVSSDWEQRNAVVT